MVGWAQGRLASLGALREDAGVRGIVQIGLLVAGGMLAGCAGGGDGSELTAIPPVPEDFEPLRSEATGYRSAKVLTPNGRWLVNFDDGIIKISPWDYNVVKLEPRWYPREGASRAALCRGYQRGNEVLIRLEGSSEVVSEETRVFFENGRIREIVKYSLPGLGGEEGLPLEVPPSERVQSQTF